LPPIPATPPAAAASTSRFMQRKYGAHLKGVVWHGPGLIETRFRAYMTRDILDVLHERDAARVAAMRADFRVRVTGRGGVAATILDACAEVGAGLLVMGAYEHSKFAQDLLGGVTRDILAQAPLPVLMSH
jgi:nucleotide-binding universal stress UspA family protein